MQTIRPFTRSRQNPEGVFVNPTYAPSYAAQVQGVAESCYVIPVDRFQNGEVASTLAIRTESSDREARVRFAQQQLQGPLPAPATVPAYYFWKQVIQGQQPTPWPR
jgi:hypothetical protein